MAGHGAESGSTGPLGNAEGGSFTEFEEEIAAGLLEGKSLSQIGRERHGRQNDGTSSRQSSHRTSKGLLEKTGFPENITPGQFHSLATQHLVEILRIIKPDITDTQIFQVIALPSEQRREIFLLAVHEARQSAEQ